jgi:hypothetical protein
MRAITSSIKAETVQDLACDMVMAIEKQIEENRRAIRILEESTKSMQATVNLLYRNHLNAVTDSI